MKKQLSEAFFDEIFNLTPSKKRITRGLNLFPKRNKLFESAISSNFGWRSLTMFMFVILVFLLFIARAMYLQVISSGVYQQLADSNKTRNSIILAERGVIYDSTGEIIVRNKPSFAVELNTGLCGNVCPTIVSKINDYVPLDKDLVKDELASGRTIVVLATNLDKETALLLETNLYQLPGVSVIVYPIRDYMYSDVFAHSIGYLGLDDKSVQPLVVGKSGIEKSYNEYLSGIPGSRISEVDSTGKKYNIVAEEDALPGRDLNLYLHKDLSVKAYELLKKIVDDKKATAGVVVAQDPSTGGILALVNYPSFDPNKLSNGISRSEYQKLLEDPNNPFFNRAVSAVYPPGSTFKMVTASAALAEKTIDRNTTIFDPGYLAVSGYRFNNWKLDGHGEVDLIRALQVSNDTYFYTIGGGYGDIKGIGIENLHKWARMLGFGSLTGIDIEGEVAGHMPDGKERAWYLGDTYITSIGQGDVLSTPLQLNNMTSYFANGGTLYKPRLVKSVAGVKNYPSEIVAQNLTTKKNYDIVREGMKAAVHSGGTAYPLFDFTTRHPGIELAGKTGTSEFINREGKPATHAWFTVFGPMEGASISLTVFLEGGGAGSDDASPVAKELMDLWFSKK
jgi:penicillin-binding protein 2